MIRLGASHQGEGRELYFINFVVSSNFDTSLDVFGHRSVMYIEVFVYISFFIADSSDAYLNVNMYKKILA